MLDACRIRPMDESDLPMVFEWRNHPDVRRFMFTQHEIGVEEHRNWFARASADPSRCLLIVQDEEQAIGYVQFNQVLNGGISNWGFYSNPNTPRGTGKKLTVSALNHAFGSLKLHKVCGQAIEKNQASIKLHRRLGFELEGVLREQQRIEGVYHNLLCFGLLARDWQQGNIFQE